MTPEEEAAQASAAVAEAEEAARAGKEAQELEEEEREPGGDSPEQIRARKEYRLRKKTESALQVEREKGIALEARVQTLQEVATKKIEQPPAAEEQRLSSAEAWAKFDAQEWTRDQVTDYIFETNYARQRGREKAEERTAREILGPIEAARKEALEYIKLDSRLADRTHPKWNEILKSVDFFRKEDPRRTDIQAERLALREVLGPIEGVKEKQRMSGARPSGDHHTETRGGGGGNPPVKGRDSFSDIPAHVKEMWDKLHTPEKDQVIEAKFYRETHAAGRR